MCSLVPYGLLATGGKPGHSTVSLPDQATNSPGWRPQDGLEDWGEEDAHRGGVGGVR